MDSNVTYFSELKSIRDIASPIINNDAMMQYKGVFVPRWSQDDVNFDYPTYGLHKSKSNRGLIFCNDASKLFSLSSGEVDISFRLSQNINSGVLDELRFRDTYLSEFVLWGVNVGQTGSVLPSVSVSFTSNGIAFTIWTSAAKFSIIDRYSTVLAGDDILIKCIWSKDALLDDFGGYKTTTLYYNCNGTEIISNPPIANDSISGLNFCVGNTPFLNSNLEMTIGKITTYDNISWSLEEEWLSSSSTSSLSSDSTSSSESSGSTSSSSSSSI